MKNDKLSVQSMDFAVSIVNLVKNLKENRESIISNQIGRSGTSIGANIHEAQYAQGTKDFISKLEISLKDAKKKSKDKDIIVCMHYPPISKKYLDNEFERKILYLLKF